MTISILGGYITKFGELWNMGLRDLLDESVHGVIENAGIDATDVEAVFVANKAGSTFENQMHLGAMVSQMFAHFPPGIRVEGACASGGLALITAQQAILSGQYSTVLVVGVEKMTDVPASETTSILSAAADVSLEKGSTFPGLYALFAQQQMQHLGLTREQLSAVAVKNHRHAMDNPQAQYHKQFTLEQISSSTLVADPLRLLDCSPITDGAAAVILSSKNNDTKPKIVGYGHANDTLDLANRESLLGLSATTKAVSKALQMSQISLEEIEAAEVHDCFTIAEIMAIEDLGFFEKGTAGPATLADKTTFDGQVVVNPSGGLKACGHPVGATGVKQVAYMAEQIEKDAFSTVLTHNIGGSGATAVVHIIKK